MKSGGLNIMNMEVWEIFFSYVQRNIMASFLVSLTCTVCFHSVIRWL